MNIPASEPKSSIEESTYWQHVTFIIGILSAISSGVQSIKIPVSRKEEGVDKVSGIATPTAWDRKNTVMRFSTTVVTVRGCRASLSFAVGTVVSSLSRSHIFC